LESLNALPALRKVSCKLFKFGKDNKFIDLFGRAITVNIRNQPGYFAYNNVMKTTIAKPNPNLAASITKAASQQTYYTIRFLADRELATDAYHAYAYFRWVDDALDAESGLRPVLSEVEASERRAFVNRQKSLLEACYRGESPCDVTPEEKMLVELIRNDIEKNSGLQSYLCNMMAVMSFDADRRGRVISQAELNEYTRFLASAVTEAMHYFIGHCCYSPHNEARYLAVTAAHITHMLRDTVDDVQAGYYNIPREVLEANHISPEDVQSDAFRAWVAGWVWRGRISRLAGSILARLRILVADLQALPILPVLRACLI
jgi:phytoene/squalene synthetase